jgi:hypothetical protein
MGAWRKGVMPLMFQEKIRMVFVSRGGRGWSLEGACLAIGTAESAVVLRRLAGGGLIPRFMLA